MNIWQAFTMALKSIAMKKTRSFLTMLGIIIGVASVVIMVSVVQGQNKKNMEYFEKMGNNKINVSAYSYYDTNNETSQKLYDYCLSLSDLVDGITPDVELGNKATVQYGAKTLSINDYSNGNYDWEKAMHIKLGSDQYGVCNNYTLAGGRELSFLDIEKTNAVCVLGAGAKTALFDYTDPVDETITINGQPFLVVGYYQPMSLDGWPEMDNIIVLPYTFNRTMNQNSTISSYVVKAKSASATTEAMTLLDAYLAGLFPKDEMGNSTGRLLCPERQQLCPGHQEPEHHAGPGAGGHRRYLSAGGRHRHHEHHAGHRDRAHPGDRHPQGHRRRAQEHHHPVFDRGGGDLLHRRPHRHRHRLRGHSGGRKAAAERDGHAAQPLHHHGSLPVLGGAGRDLRHVSRHQGLRSAAGGGPAGGVSQRNVKSEDQKE